MPAPFAGAAATEATIVPWYSSRPNTVCSLKNEVFARPANSGCVGSTPVSTIAIGTPGPGGVARSAPMCESHHSCADNGSARRAAVAVPANASTRRTAARTGRTSAQGSLPSVTRAYIGLGANLGDREATIRSALADLSGTPEVKLLAVSTLLETEPVGYLDQPRFLNGVAVLETSLAPRELLDLLLPVDVPHGRDP